MRGRSWWSCMRLTVLSWRNPDRGFSAGVPGDRPGVPWGTGRGPGGRFAGTACRSALSGADSHCGAGCKPSGSRDSLHDLPKKNLARLFRKWYILNMPHLTPDEYGSKQRPAISGRRVRALCEQNRIKGAERVGRSWIIPDDAKINIRDLRIRRK